MRNLTRTLALAFFLAGAASAATATAYTCSRVEMPKPTTTGSAVWALMRSTAWGMPAANSLRAPVTLWNPTIRVLKGKHAPNLTFLTSDPAGTQFYEESLVVRKTVDVLVDRLSE